MFVEAPSRDLGVVFRFVLYLPNYPNSPGRLDFLQTEPMPHSMKGHEAGWPDDGERRFRILTAFPAPFVCMPGLVSYRPDQPPSLPYSRKDLLVGIMLGGLYAEMNDGTVRGVKYDGR